MNPLFLITLSLLLNRILTMNLQKTTKRNKKSEFFMKNLLKGGFFHKIVKKRLRFWAKSQ
ncbi:hypothetical protein C6W20_12975 [Bacillus sp. NMCN6]|nr:hypothetical protein C6W21_13340 [Bacillus sp. NMCN1]PRR98467.1 hypothetical protein C6W20_12975 [Bacillus sp. NMCN6]